jgi:lipoate-protein ligase B
MVSYICNGQIVITYLVVNFDAQHVIVRRYITCLNHGFMN